MSGLKLIPKQRTWSLAISILVCTQWSLEALSFVPNLSTRNSIPTRSTLKVGQFAFPNFQASRAPFAAETEETFEDDEDWNYDSQDLDEYDDPSMDMNQWREQIQTMQQTNNEIPIVPVPAKPIRPLKRPKKIPLIAIVGRPNVGKSALVNRIAGSQSAGAIVADEAGITRDRTYRAAEFLGERFQVVDTGGIVYDDNDAIFAKEIRDQAMIAISEASGVIFVVDGQAGMTALDQQVRFLD